jgi:hypothetical protein
MKVYVVLRDETEWRELIGVYSTKEKAEEVSKSLTTYYRGSPSVVFKYGVVEEVELDATTL